jgi:formate hydrogenlyase transcriptional activator
LSATPWSGETKYRAMLAVAEATNAHLDLSSVLDAVSEALAQLVPVDVLALVTRDGEVARMLGGHVGPQPRRSDEAAEAYFERAVPAADRELMKQEIRRHLDLLEQGHGPIVVDDLLHDTRLPFQALIRLGGRALAILPLWTGSRFLGSLSFARLVQRPFSPEEVQILQDISRPLGIAVANALAYEEIAHLRARLEEENVALQEEIAATTSAGGILGSSAGMRSVLDRVARVAGTEATVLITGETGTGKELIARAIHAASSRARRALIKVNCAALPEGLIGSELFGHERGAFTGATERRRGRFELAAGGTIFLDEVGELPAAMQVALLRVLQEGEFERVGGSETLRTDARVVAATNRDLDRAVAEGSFRSDLLFRLNVFPVRVPPLRERREDIRVIAEYYASHYGRSMGKRVRGIGPEAMEALLAYAWPGNVRELQNLVERAVILARGQTLEVTDFELPGLQGPAVLSPASERQRIEEALRASRGRVSGAEGAAEALGVAPSTLESRIRRLGIDKFAFRPRGAGTPAE